MAWTNTDSQDTQDYVRAHERAALQERVKALQEEVGRQSGIIHDLKSETLRIGEVLRHAEVPCEKDGKVLEPHERVRLGLRLAANDAVRTAARAMLNAIDPLL